jgi:hypothetical protein
MHIKFPIMVLTKKNLQEYNLASQNKTKMTKI